MYRYQILGMVGPQSASIVQLTNHSNAVLYKLSPFSLTSSYPVEDDLGVSEAAWCTQLKLIAKCKTFERNLDRRNAPNNSRQGMLWSCRGDTIVLAVMKCTENLPVVSM